jgi:hypothetical protein
MPSKRKRDQDLDLREDPPILDAPPPDSLLSPTGKLSLEERLSNLRAWRAAEATGWRVVQSFQNPLLAQRMDVDM